MPTLVERTLREFRRYTGDGLPGEPTNAPLPIGDPQSGPHNPSKAELRDALRPLETLGEIALAILNQVRAVRDTILGYAADIVSQGNVPIYSTAAGVAGYTVPNFIVAFRTNGFSASDDGGGAFYTSTSAATPGGITDAAGRRFRLNEPRYNVKMFGARGNGVVDDRAAIQLAADCAAANDKPLYIPNDFFLINSTISEFDAIRIATDRDVSIHCEGVLIAGANIASTITANGRVLRVQSNTVQTTPTQKLTIRGLRINGRALPRGNIGIDLLSIGPRFASVDIEGCDFDHGRYPATGADLGNGGGDSSIFCLRPDRIAIRNCTFRGANDSGVYLSAGTDIAELGRDAVVTDCKFLRCNNALSLKRDFTRANFSNNHVYECGNGINFGIAGTSTTNQGKQAIIAGNFMSRIQGTPLVIQNTHNVTVVGNVITDFRRWISDGSTATVAGSSNIGAAIQITGCDGISVTGNVMGFRDWLPAASPIQTVGVALLGYNTGTERIFTRNCIVTGNVIRGCHRAFVTSFEAEHNVLTPNRAIGCTEEDFIDGVGNGLLPLLGNRDSGIDWLGDNAVSIRINDEHPLRVYGSDGQGDTHVGVFSSPLNQAPMLRPNGTAANIDLRIEGKGDGLLQLTAPYASETRAANCTVMIKVRDATNGTVRTVRLLGQLAT